jgi:hypothetical protein
MEARNITIVSTKNQNKYVVNTDATTLRELKAALDANRIDYADMTFYEGLSHTELLTDDSVLPHDVPYKGQVTNELVFMLTVPNKKIRSGASLPDTRSALYDAIKELNLEDVCVSTYGKNFTLCKNSELMALIEDAQAAAEEAVEDKASNVEKALNLLINILEEDTYLTESDADAIREVLNGEDAAEANSPYTDGEIEDMFDFVN